MINRDYTFLVGTYSDMDALAHQPHAPSAGDGIHAVNLRADLSVDQGPITETLNPAVLIPHPNGKSLYAILETIQSTGTVERYEVQPDGKLNRCEQTQANGLSTCYLALSPKKDCAIVINYWDAIIDVCSVDEQGRLGEFHQSFKQYYRPTDQWRQVKDREDHWVNRQVGPHAHCAHFWHDWVFIPDLGENAVFQYHYDAESKHLTPQTHIEFEPGSGPRHMVIHPSLDICYISNELFNTVCVAKLDSTDPDSIKKRLEPIQYESTLDDRESTSYVSEIKLSPDARFLYISNRGDNSIATFAVQSDGSLTRTALTPTGGKFPRHFAITPCGGALIASNQDSGNIRVFDRDVDTGVITDTGTVLDVPAPCYVRFI